MIDIAVITLGMFCTIIGLSVSYMIRNVCKDYHNHIENIKEEVNKNYIIVK